MQTNRHHSYASLLGLALLGCGGSTIGEGDACDPADDNCGGGLVCSADGVCVPATDASASDGSTGVPDARPDATEIDGGPCADGRPECGGACCEPTETCTQDICVPSLPCGSDAECQEDSYCYEDLCIPYGTGPRDDHNPECTQVSIAGLFQPAIQCEFVAPPAGDPFPSHVRVLSTPLVVDFDFDDDPAVIRPSLVVMTYNGNDGSSGYYNGAYGIIRVLDGQTCESLYTVGDQLNGCNTPAIADLDLDGRPEIVAHTGLGGIAAYRYDAAADSFVSHCTGPLTFAAQATGWSGPSVYDLDADGSPEIQSGGITYDADCNVLDQSLGLTTHMYRGAGYPVAADLDGVLDGEGKPSVELAVGSAVFRFNRLTSVWDTVWSGGPLNGYVAVADFGTFTADPTEDDRLILDGIPEIAIVSAPNVYITTWMGRQVYGPVALPTGQGGGPPTIGDFDGDGLPEISATGSAAITVFDPDCRGLPDLVRCSSLRSDGILWWQPSQDLSSNITGSSLFDFEGDGRVEVVYADEVFIRVYDGQTGEVLFSQWHSSCTWNENPVVADVDGDFNAEIVVPSNSNCSIVPNPAGGITYPLGPNGFYMDPFFKGLRCEYDAECASGTCDVGFCRCATDDDCGGTGSGFVCATPVAGTPGTGNTCRSEWRGAYDGVRVYGDVLDRWVTSRTIWSQHAYSVTHIREDGTVQPTQGWVPNWLTDGMNHFRQNTQGEANAISSPDMTGSQGVQVGCNPDGSATLEVRVCNRGTQPVGQGVPVAFYVGDPSDGTLACTAETLSVVPPGDCVLVSCAWPTPPGQANPADVTVVVDDDGTGAGENTECVEGNNSASIPGVFCLVVP